LKGHHRKPSIFFRFSARQTGQPCFPKSTPAGLAMKSDDLELPITRDTPFEKIKAVSLQIDKEAT